MAIRKTTILQTESINCHTSLCRHILTINFNTQCESGNFGIVSTTIYINHQRICIITIRFIVAFCFWVRTNIRLRELTYFTCNGSYWWGNFNSICFCEQGSNIIACPIWHIAFSLTLNLVPSTLINGQFLIHRSFATNYSRWPIATMLTITTIGVSRNYPCIFIFGNIIFLVMLINTNKKSSRSTTCRRFKFPLYLFYTITMEIRISQHKSGIGRHTLQLHRCLLKLAHQILLRDKNPFSSTTITC